MSVGLACLHVIATGSRARLAEVRAVAVGVLHAILPHSMNLLSHFCVFCMTKHSLDDAVKCLSSYAYCGRITSENSLVFRTSIWIVLSRLQFSDFYLLLSTLLLIPLAI